MSSKLHGVTFLNTNYFHDYVNSEQPQLIGIDKQINSLSEIRGYTIIAMDGINVVNIIQYKYNYNVI